MSYLRFIAFPMLLISSVASAGDIESTLSLCAKTALGERASEKTAVNFDTRLPMSPKKTTSTKETFLIDIADGVSHCVKLSTVVPTASNFFSDLNG